MNLSERISAFLTTAGETGTCPPIDALSLLRDAHEMLTLQDRLDDRWSLIAESPTLRRLCVSSPLVTDYPFVQQLANLVSAKVEMDKTKKTE